MPLSTVHNGNPLHVLVVTSDCPSHPYAAAKLSAVLGNAGHEVTLAAPEGPAYECIKQQSRFCEAVHCVAAGTVATKEHINSRSVMDPLSWSTLWNALLNPFPLAKNVNRMFDEQEGMYEAVKGLAASHDVVVAIHSVSATVCDAVEAATGGRVPCVILSSLPYDPAVYLGERRAWAMPRSLVTFPHVSLYPEEPSAGDPIGWIVQRFWQVVDAWLTNRAWRCGEEANNRRRAARGLPPMKGGYRGYLQMYPGIAFGGTEPFAVDAVLSSNVTAIGSLNSPKEAIEGDLKEWLDKAADDGIIYAAFGTGTRLSEREIAAITGEVPRLLILDPETSQKASSVLLALRPSEQRRLRQVIDAAVGSMPTSSSESHLEYLHGTLRIQDEVPQAAILNSGQVKLFVSHLGFGGFCEGVEAGVPFVAYPSGLDQYQNTQRAVDAGVAIRASNGMANLGEVVKRALADDLLIARAHEAYFQLRAVNGEQKALRAVEAAARSRHDRSSSDLLMTMTKNIIPIKDGPNFHSEANSSLCRRQSLSRRRSSTAPLRNRKPL